MKTRKTLTFLVLILILVSLYWNFKLLRNKGYTRNKNDEENVTSSGSKNQFTSSEYAATEGGSKVTDTSPSPALISTSNPYLEVTKYDRMQKLLQLEAKLNQSHKVARVVFVGTTGELHSEIPLYKHSLLKHGYTIHVQTLEDINDIDLSPWSFLMCYIQPNPGQLSCLSEKRLSKLHFYQKVSYIPGFAKVLISLENFCYTMSQAQHITVFSNSPLSVPCYVLPLKHTLKLKMALETAAQSSLFLIRKLHHGSYNSVFVKKESLDKRLLHEKGVLQIIPNPLLVGDFPVIVKLYVMITSLFPLRIYRHQDGKAMIMNPDKDIKETWSLEEFYVFLNKQHNNPGITKSKRQMDNNIVNTLMVSESLTSGHTSHSHQSAFQLLEFHFTFNSSLHPFLLEVQIPDRGSVLPSVANDTVNLLLNARSLSRHVDEILGKLKDRIGIEGVNCRKVHILCLGENELVYLLESHKEDSAQSSFKKLYPSCGSRKFQTLLDALQSSGIGMVTNGQRGTSQLHRVLLMIENHVCQGNRPDKDNTRNMDMRKSYWETDDDSNPEKMALQDEKVPRQSLHTCRDDPATKPVLTELLSEPSRKLKPAFNSNILEYKIVFPFEVMVVKVWGKTSTCWSEVRVNGRVQTRKESESFSLGVGWNRLVVYLMKISPQPKLLSKYILNIYRGIRDEGKTTFHSHLPHDMCTIKQDCDLKVFPGMPCGPQKTAPTSFEEFQSSRKKLPLCHGGDVPGSWVVPCTSCNQTDSCYWNKALWTPQSCQHKRITTREAKTCLAKKKILFVGDSTNRGMMYYLMEKINGSLHQWEKTHSMKIYSSALNDDQTSVSFAYFPQFWLPAGRKPVFIKALHHLIVKFMPLTNSSDTILVVGGVQWLLPDHVIAMKTTLTSLGLSGIKVIIKTLGSGFHLPVLGLVQLNLEGQHRVFQRNQLLLKTAKTCGFDVVDTYSLTIARYKEFLMGKCGCHFHKVINMKSHTLESLDNGLELDSRKDNKARQARYHVIGPINSAYAEIMITRMCS